MIVQCPACNSRYRIRDANIPSTGGKIRCPSCAHSFVVYPEAQENDDDDRTSITNPNALNQLVSKMATKVPPPSNERTATLDKDEMNRIRAFQAMSKDLGGDDDGTVEIQNPMDVWRRAQAAAIPTDESSEADDYDAAPTEIVSDGNLPKLPFPSSKPKLSAPSAEQPPRLPVPGFDSSPSANLPNTGPSFDAPSSDPFATRPTGDVARPAPPKPAPPKPAPPKPAPPKPAFQTNPPPFVQGKSTLAHPQNDRLAAQNRGGYDQPKSDPFGQSFAQPPRPQAGYQQAPQHPDESSTQQLSNPFTGLPAPTPNANASDDILAAIDEISQASEAPQATTPDATHQGPWKLKTDFGLTYEFPDVKSLRNWLSGRDETDGFKLSADGINFFGIRDFPQFERRVNTSQVGIQQPPNLAGLPGSEPLEPGVPNFGQPSFTPPPSSQSGMFGGPVVAGQYASYHGGPLPAAPLGPPIQNEYKPPAGAADQHRVLWAIFVVLLVICIVVGLQTFGVVDVLGLLGLDKKPVQAPVEPQAQERVASIDNLVNNVDNDIDGLLKEVRRDLKNKKLQSALDRLNTVETLAPERPEIFELRAKAYDSLGEAEKAEAARARAQELADRADEDPQPTATPDAGADSN